MIKKRTSDLLEFPLPFELIKKDNVLIPGVFLSGLCVALAIRDRIYSKVQILCTTDDAYEELKTLDKTSVSFRPYSNVRNFILNVTVYVHRTNKPAAFNGLNVCNVMATPSHIFTENEEYLERNAVNILNSNWEQDDLLKLHNAGLDIMPVISTLKSAAKGVL